MTLTYTNVFSTLRKAFFKCFVILRRMHQRSLLSVFRLMFTVKRLC